MFLTATERRQWVGEWEAALDKLIDAILKTPLEAMSNERWKDSRSAVRRLEKIVEANRHSPTGATPLLVQNDPEWQKIATELDQIREKISNDPSCAQR